MDRGLLKVSGGWQFRPQRCRSIAAFHRGSSLERRCGTGWVSGQSDERRHTHPLVPFLLSESAFDPVARHTDFARFRRGLPRSTDDRMRCGAGGGRRSRHAPAGRGGLPPARVPSVTPGAFATAPNWCRPARPEPVPDYSPCGTTNNGCVGQRESHPKGRTTGPPKKTAPATAPALDRQANWCRADPRSTAKDPQAATSPTRPHRPTRALSADARAEHSRQKGRTGFENSGARQIIRHINSG